MTRAPKPVFAFVVTLLAASLLIPAAGAQTEPPSAVPTTQTPYQPKFRGDPAKSEAESQVLGYMRTVVRAEKVYFKRHNQYPPALLGLAGTGSFTRRMAHDTQRA